VKRMTDQPITPLGYAHAHDARPRWVTRLAVASIIVASVLLLLHALRMGDARLYVFDPTFRWAYPPPLWLPPAYLGSVVACIVVAMFLLVVGVTSLVVPRLAASLHQIYVAAQVVVAFASAWLHALLMLKHPDVSAGNMVFEVAITGLVYSIYAIVVQIVLRGNVPSR
jgi:hypothetical protein